MTKKSTSSKTIPPAYEVRVQEAQDVLRHFGLPPSPRSALTLLALLELGPEAPWSHAKNPSLRIAALIDFIRERYGVPYAANTRETIRKDSIKPFVEVGLLEEPAVGTQRPKTSPNYAYRVTTEALAEIRLRDDPGWPGNAAPALRPNWRRLHQGMTTELDLATLRLRNFRSLEDTGVIELRPIVVLIGQNSSGKSSFLRFFPLLRQTHEERTAGPLLWLGKDVDFGDFSHVVRQAAADRVIEIELGVTLDGAAMRVDALLGESSAETVLRECRIEDQHGAAVVHLAPDGEVVSLQIGEVLIQGPLLGLRAESGGLIPRFSLEALERVSLTDRALRSRVRQLLVRLMVLSSSLTTMASRIHYMGPIRQGPQRFYRKRGLRAEQLDPVGGNLVDFLANLGEVERGSFTTWVKDYFGFQVNLRRDGTANYVIEIVERDRSYNLIDMGYGFSQVLPIITQSWAATRSRRAQSPTLLTVEQPELHLHPRYQASLADMFARLIRAEGKSAARPRVIIETHSEALVSRLGELVAAGRLGPGEVLVVLFEKDPETGNTAVRHTEFNEKGFLRDWPIGFFAP